jgi:hypothetical protein
LLESIVILAAGCWAGMINVVVGSGTLVTFPTLLLFGYSPVVANVSNTIGLVGGGLSGTFGYRRELGGKRDLLRRLLPASAIGALAGALLLLVLPEEAFRAIVPVLIFIGLLMVVGGPALQRRATRGHDDRAAAGARMTPARLAGLTAGVCVLGVYGGYFGAAQGILIVGLMSVLTVEPLQSINGIKNVLTTVVNAVAAATFMIVAWDSVAWHAVLLIAVGATLGGVAGAKFGRRLSPPVMRTLIVIVGTVAIVKIVFFG